MTRHVDISDETLTAFLDGALSAEDSALVAEQLETQDGLAERLAALDVPILQLKDSADAFLSHAPPAPPLPKPAMKMALPRMAALAAAIVAGVAIGATLNRGSEQDWVSAVANYQSLYVTDTLAKSEPPETRRASLSALSEGLGLDLTALADIKSIDYRRAQMLGYEGAPLVQVAYLDQDVPIAICITRRPGKDRALREETLFGMAAASWQQDGHGFLVIGGEDPDLIRQISEQVRASL